MYSGVAAFYCENGNNKCYIDYSGVLHVIHQICTYSHACAAGMHGPDINRAD